ncbi:MAG TPA: hypothetical protein VGO00_13445 [Kofleriaceae bacterium]|nr:hypothetical protein [Kofleriaceae bacterium]
MFAALATPAGAAPTCADQLAAYDKWVAPIRADVGNGAWMSDRVDELFAAPLHKGTLPKSPAMTLVVDVDGLHDGTKPARPISQAASMIEGNTNISFGRSNPQSISHGILVLAIAKAPAASVRAAVVAALASKEPVWLVFKPSDGKAAAPPKSAVTADLDKVKSSDVSGLVTIIQREFGACGGLMTMMQHLASDTEDTRASALVDQPRAALDKCQCKPSPAVIASILWKMAFQQLAVLISVPAKATLPWGDAKGTWNDIAPAIVAALAK